jgi:hypothetical protein
MENKMTAVEFLENQYNTNGKLTPVDFYQASELFEQQIIDAHVYGHNAPSSTLKNFDAKQYYLETYKKNNI